MAHQRHMYETAFDCKISRSEDDLNDIDRLTNHSLIISPLRSNSTTSLSRATSTNSSKQKNFHQTTIQNLKDQQHKFIVLHSRAVIPSQASRLYKQQQMDHSKALLKQQQINNLSNLSQNIESLQTNSINENNLFNHSACSISNEKQVEYSQFKNMKHSITSVFKSSGHSTLSKENNIAKFKDRPKSFISEKKDLILEFKSRPIDVSNKRIRSRNLVHTNKPIIEFKGRPGENKISAKCRINLELQRGFHEYDLLTNERRLGYSSTESMATSSIGGSMESLRSSTSEGNCSTSSKESRQSTSLSSHSSDNSNTNRYKHQSSFSNFLSCTSKLQMLSPISDKSLQDPVNETYDYSHNNNLHKFSSEKLQPTETDHFSSDIDLLTNLNTITDLSLTLKERRAVLKKNFVNSVLQSSSSGDAEIQGSDSGISIESRTGIKCNKTFGFQLVKASALSLQQNKQYLNNMNQIVENEQELTDLPFDMPKLRRRRILVQQDTTTSGSVTSVDLKDLPFDMPKLRRRLRCAQSIESSTSQTSSSLSVKDGHTSSIFGSELLKPRMTLNLCNERKVENISSVSFNKTEDINNQRNFKKSSNLSLGLSLDLINDKSIDLVDIKLPLERQSWYHGSLTRIEAESVLRLLQEGSYLVRNSESTKQDYSLSLKSARGFMHMRIQKNEELNAYILGQFSKPFNSIPELVRHFSINRLPIRGAEHMCLLHPVIAQLL